MIFIGKHMGVLILTTIREMKITNVTISPLYTSEVSCGSYKNYMEG